MKVLMYAIILLATPIVGCANNEKRLAILNSWIGHNADELASKWGYPTNSFKTPSGNTVYVYSSSGSFTLPRSSSSTYNTIGNTTYGSTQMYGGQSFNMWCNTFFEMDEAGKIVSGRSEGNNC